MKFGQSNTDSLQPCQISPSTPDEPGQDLCLKAPAVCEVFVCGKDVAIIALLLIEKWVKGYSYKFPKRSE